MAACALVIVIAHLLCAPLTLGLAAAFTLTGRAARWQPRWLLGPAAAGLLWTLAIGPGAAIAGFTRGPARVLGYFGGGHLAERLAQPLTALAGAGGWLPAQAPLALCCAAAEAAVVCWLDWLHTDEWALRQARPGPAAALRRIFAARTIRAGGVLTRAGCALGTEPATGAVAELRWDEIAAGALVVGADPAEVAVTCLQLVHAALRRRKPLIVLDGGGGANAAVGVPGAVAGVVPGAVAGVVPGTVAAAVAAACHATGTPLWREPAGARPVPASGAAERAALSASRLWGRGGPAAGREGTPEPGADPDGILVPVIRERRAALLAVDSPELIARAAAGLAAAAARLRRLGVAGDALVWVPEAARLPPATLAAMIRDGAAAGLPVLAGTTSPAAAAAMAGLVGTLLVHRVADAELAASLAARTGTWLLPAAALSGLAAGPGGLAAGPGGLSGGPAVLSGGPAVLSGGPGGLSGGPAGPDGVATTVASPPGLVRCPRVPPRTLLTLGPGRFVLAVSGPRPRLLTGGQVVPARLPPAGRGEKTSRERAGP